MKRVIGIGWTVVVDGQTKRVCDDERHAHIYKRKLEREAEEKNG